MASPCELLMALESPQEAERLLKLAAEEAWRIEAKFSRYREDNIVHRINAGDGKPIEVDEETAALLDFADQCFELSEGLFDITSGVLREVWHFDGSDKIPSEAAVAAVLPRVGWQRLTWARPMLTLPAGMQIDFGGIGKEYAVDRVVGLLRGHSPASILVNFGGDLAVTRAREDNRPWLIGVDDPENTGKGACNTLQLTQGALATSGDARRYLLHEGVRYGHVLDPRTGWPVQGAPRSVTVAAATCTEAGMLATFALLQGRDARAFLDAQELRYWCLD